MDPLLLKIILGVIVFGLAQMVLGYWLRSEEVGHRRRVEALLHDVHGRLVELTEQGRQIVTNNERIAAALERIDTATNNVAADIKNIKDELAAKGVDPALLERLDTAATTLEGIAASTEDPVPGDGGGSALEDEG